MRLIVIAGLFLAFLAGSIYMAWGTLSLFIGA